MIAMLRFKLVHFRSLEDDGTSVMTKVRQYHCTSLFSSLWMLGGCKAITTTAAAAAAAFLFLSISSFQPSISLPYGGSIMHVLAASSLITIFLGSFACYMPRSALAVCL
jgi:hypothetical protein